MKISRNWLNNYITSNRTDDQLVDEFTQLGLECTSSKINSIDSNIVIGKVVKCIKHPNADKLKVCDVDVNGDELLSIVCGAPNVKDNILVPVAKVGAKFGTFKIKKTKIRDIVSNGMICSEKELGLSDNHEGIMILDNNFKKGHQLKDFLSIEEDTIFDFDITPNRGDCFSHLGIARELSVIENIKLKEEKIEFKKTDFNTSDLISVNVTDPVLCPRYACRIIKNINVTNATSNIMGIGFAGQVTLMGHIKIKVIDEYIIEKGDIILNDKSITVDGNEALIEHTEVLDLIEYEIGNAMKSFSQHERVKKFVLAPRLLTIDKGELTPKMSIVRKVVLSNFDDLIDSMYNTEGIPNDNI